MRRALADPLLPGLDHDGVQVRNGVGDGALNDGCGAEHVQKGRRPPRGVAPAADRGRQLCSLDGDADRLVFHHWPAPDGPAGGPDPAWSLLDGDKIAVLCADFLLPELAALGAGGAGGAARGAPFSLGCVQTAYANGAATAYLRSVGVTVAFAKTGVKFVHHAALAYDVGVYFEANGHGTVIFKPAVLTAAAKVAAAPAGRHSARQTLAAARLLASARLINQAVGDGISDLLFVQGVLRLRGWGLEQWDRLYSDRPSRQCKLAVADRTAVVPQADEMRLLEVL